MFFEACPSASPPQQLCLFMPLLVLVNMGGDCCFLQERVALIYQSCIEMSVDLRTGVMYDRTHK